MTFVFLALLLQSAPSATAIVQDALRKIDQADTATVTLVRGIEEFPGRTRTRYWFRKGGSFRAEAGPLVDVSDPRQGWTYQTEKKIYQSRPPIPPTMSFASIVGLDLLRAGLPIVGAPRQMAWHGHPAIRIELDGRKRMTKETKLFAFFDPKSHLPLGYSANLGSVTQLAIFEDLKLDPKIDGAKFQFVPPKDWKQVTAATGGWN